MDGKSVLITGAGSGIGRAAAVAFAKQGAVVVAVDKSATSAAATVDLIAGIGERGHAIACDIADAASVSAMFAEAVEIFDGIDFAFNNAGIGQSDAATAELSVDEWDNVLKVNLSGVFYCMREELRYMSARGFGAIVNTASLAGLRTIKQRSAYVASKHAVVGLTKNAAVEYAHLGVRINAICPGGVATPLFEQMLTDAGLSVEQRVAAKKNLENAHPMMRIAEAAEIADGVIFLCSDKASFITGVCLSVDGGWAAL